MIYFVSDTHFGHDNIIKYSDRPVKNVTEMNRVLIDNWNSVVQKGDTVYHVGDFSFGSGSKDPDKYFYQLNGKKHLIKGNHDNKRTLDLPWESVSDVKIIKVEKQQIFLQHYSMRTWYHSYKGVWMIYGHSHGTLPETDDLTFDVGVDCWGLRPISFEEVKKKMEWKQKNPGYFARHFKSSKEDRRELPSDAEMEKNQKRISKINQDILSGIM